jgi:hypothetical protein
VSNIAAGKSAVHSLTPTGKPAPAPPPEPVVSATKGSLDGIVALGDGLLISSWEASAVYCGKPGGTFEVVLPEQKALADIGYDTKRGRVLVPHFTEGTVEAYDLK